MNMVGTSNLYLYSSSFPIQASIGDVEEYTVKSLTEEKKDIQTSNDLSITRFDAIEFRTAYWTKDTPLSINLELNFDNIEKRRLLYDLNTEEKDINATFHI
ncbi:MAG: hypothetical protein JSV30_06640 [Candidatus Omnitrophota bacterium]|nr:MAG: hypothetical protein JSV30_06640 [Candidatus Omnitrophota bacterium]